MDQVIFVDGNNPGRNALRGTQAHMDGLIRQGGSPIVLSEKSILPNGKARSYDIVDDKGTWGPIEVDIEDAPAFWADENAL